MSGRQRVALLLGAVAVAAVAFALLRPDDEEPSRSSSQAEVTQPATSSAERRPKTKAAPTPKPTEIRVRGGQPAGGIEAISTRKGETVRFVVTSDAPAQVHAHGYDIFRDVAPGRPARFRFPAEIEGVFEVELEGSHTQIARLTVEP